MRRADFASLTICFFLGGSFLVPGPAVSASPICNRLALHLGKLSRVPLFPHFAFGLRIIRVASANPFSSVAALPLFFSALRVRSSSRISFILHPTRGREKVDGRSIHFLNSRGGHKTLRASSCSGFLFFFITIFFVEVVKFSIFLGVYPTLLDDGDEKKKRRTLTTTVFFCFLVFRVVSEVLGFVS